MTATAAGPRQIRPAVTSRVEYTISANACRDAKADRGQIRECLKAHEAELSDGCRAAIQEARAHHHPRG